MTKPFSIETSRLQCRWLDHADAEFIYQLVNDPDWMRFIGDKQVSSVDAARAYIKNGPRAMYQQFGFGLNRVALKDSDIPIGICGLLQRESLPCPDLGFAFLPGYRSLGFAQEAATAVLQHGCSVLKQTHIAAIVSPENIASIRLIEKLGFAIDEQIQMEPNTGSADLYTIHVEC
jgi:ribosomal-protein-alanine N-acetyltransferase